MKRLFQKFSLKKIGAMLFVFLVSLSIWVALFYQQKEDDINRNISAIEQEKSDYQEIHIPEKKIEEKIEEKKENEKGNETFTSNTLIKESETTGTADEKDGEKENIPKETLPKTDLDYYQLAMKNKDVLNCREISDETLSQQCNDDILLTLSITKQSSSGCEDLSSDVKKQYCKDQVLWENIKKNNGYNKCNEIKNILLQKQCVESGEKSLLASARKKSDCEGISDEVLHSQCTRRFLTLEDFNFSPFVCDTLPEGGDKFFCQKMTITSSLKRGKKISCSIFFGEILEYCILKKTDATDQALYKKAKEKKRYQYCNKISDDELKNECTRSVIYAFVWEKKDVQFCQLLDDESEVGRCEEEQGSRLNSFYYRQAKLDYDKSLCLQINDVGMQEKCIGFFKKN